MRLTEDEVVTLYRASNEVELLRTDAGFGLPIRRSLAKSDDLAYGTASYVSYVLHAVAAATSDTPFGDACLVLAERIRTEKDA